MDQHWKDFIAREMEQPYFEKLEEAIAQDEKHHLVFPKPNDRLNAFKLTPYDAVKVVIIGQDPYHEIGQAQGLSFSVPKGFPLPPSLRNIFTELKNDLEVDHFDNGCLEGWAAQGVFLINSILTVRVGKALSHAKFGWDIFFVDTIKELNQRETPMIFVLWGKKAQVAKQWIDMTHHGILESNHPSPLSAHRGFFGSKPFSTINQWLTDHQQTPIDWSK